MSFCCHEGSQFEPLLKPERLDALTVDCSLAQLWASCDLRVEKLSWVRTQQDTDLRSHLTSTSRMACNWLKLRETRNTSRHSDVAKQERVNTSWTGDLWSGKWWTDRTDKALGQMRWHGLICIKVQPEGNTGGLCYCGSKRHRRNLGW